MLEISPLLITIDRDGKFHQFLMFHFHKYYDENDWNLFGITIHEGRIYEIDLLYVFTIQFSFKYPLIFICNNLVWPTRKFLERKRRG